MKNASWALALLAAVSLVVSVYAQKPQVESEGVGGEVAVEGFTLVEYGMQIAPLRIAKIDEFGNVIGDWVELGEPGVSEDCGAYLCYDAFESDTRTGLPSDGFYGQNCGQGGARYYINADNQDRVFIEDFVMQGGCNGIEIGRVEHAWWWKAGGSGTSERCVIFLNTLEDWENAGNCTHSGVLDGVAIDFGVVPSSFDVGYVFTDLSLCLAGITLTGPADGSGSYRIAYAKDEFGTLATAAQPMLWGDSKLLNEGGSTRRHFSDLDNDNVIDSGECKSYNFGLCLDPLGAATSFWRVGGAWPKLRASCEGGTYIVRAKNFGPPGERVTFKLDGGANNNKQVRPSGRCNIKFNGVASGPHTVSASSAAFGATIYRNYSCP